MLVVVKCHLATTFEQMLKSHLYSIELKQYNHNVEYRPFPIESSSETMRDSGTIRNMVSLLEVNIHKFLTHSSPSYTVQFTQTYMFGSFK